MKYIKKISAQDFLDGMKKLYEVASVEDFFEVKGLYPLDEDQCYATLDNNCYYILRARDTMLGYFALDKGRLSNIKGLWEFIYEMVCQGYSWIRINGKNRRYTKLAEKNAVKDYILTKPLETNAKDHEEFWWFAGHPIVLKEIERRMR